MLNTVRTDGDRRVTPWYNLFGPEASEAAQRDRRRQLSVASRGRMLYKRLMDEERLILEALKWIVLVFAAGFVGYFGKFLGIQFISWLKKRREEKTGRHSPDRSAEFGTHERRPPDVPVRELEAPAPPQSGNDTAREPSSIRSGREQENLVKKTQKEHLKQRKKHAKAVLKQRKKESDQTGKD